LATGRTKVLQVTQMKVPARDGSDGCQTKAGTKVYAKLVVATATAIKGRGRQSSAEFGKPQGRQNISDGDTADVRLGGAVRV
jgi:hypothetical protein